MDAYHIERFGSVDGIVLRSSEDPRPGPKEIPHAGPRELAQLPRFDGPQRRRSRSNEDRRSAAVRRRRRGCSDRRRSYSGQNWRPDCRLLSSALVWTTDQARSAGWQPPVPSDVPSHAQTAALARVFSPTVPRFTSETDPLAEREGFEHSVPRKGTTFFRQESFSAVVGGCEIPGDCADMNKKRQSRPCTSLRIAA
jgi:hypothetical protein